MLGRCRSGAGSSASCSPAPPQGGGEAHVGEVMDEGVGVRRAAAPPKRHTPPRSRPPHVTHLAPPPPHTHTPPPPHHHPHPTTTTHTHTHPPTPQQQQP